MHPKGSVGPDEAEILGLVREKYAAVAKGGQGACVPSCCGGAPVLVSLMEKGKTLGYAERDLAVAPGEANLGLGCGNPVGRAALMQGETVLDLGSGAGFDAFLAAERVGASGRVIGVDMTPEMVERARQNASRMNVPNVEFRLGQIERLPVEDGSIDCVLSNCVINLSPDKVRVFGEMHRTLRPGGRIVISDILRSRDLPEAIRGNAAAYSG